MIPEWAKVADNLESMVSGPTAEQHQLAQQLEKELDKDLPAPVAAAVLRHALMEPLRIKTAYATEIPEVLHEIEEELKVPFTEELVTGTKDELSAWFESRYMLKTANGLRSLQPEPGYVVARIGDNPEARIVSSIGADGRVYFKGLPPAKAWPNYLEVIAKPDAENYDEVTSGIEARLLNERTTYKATESRLAPLQAFKLSSERASPEAVLELEHLLESGEKLEGRFQKLIERHPGLLAFLASGNHGCYVIPQKRLGAEFITDFLVLGLNSLGPQWVAVEIEAPSHKLLTKKNKLTTPVRHTVEQIRDWREWLTQNVAYAQQEHGLWGLTNRVPGLVVIGRSFLSGDRDTARSQLSEDAHIEVHSWDWVLREARASLTGFPYRQAYGNED